MISAALRPRQALRTEGLARRSAPFLALLLLGFVLLWLEGPTDLWFCAAAR